MVNMPSTASEDANQPRYGFAFAWDGPYGHAVRMVQRLDPIRGVVLDLGCGHGAVAEPLGDIGYGYVGADIDEQALDALRARL